MKLKSLAKVATVCLFGVVGGGGTSWAGVVTESFSFDNNQMPAGWGYFYRQGSNLQIVNNRLEVGQVNTSGGIYRPFDPTGVSKVQIDYDANIANVSSGQSNAAMLLKNPANLEAGYAYAGAAKSGFGQNTMLFYADLQNPVGPYSRIIGNVTHAVFGNYHVSTTFQDGFVSLAVTPIGATTPIFSSGLVTAPGFQLSAMSNLALFGVTTTGASAWIDNAVITTTTTAAPTMVGNLPTPDKFTSQVVPFALKNLGTLSTIALQNGNNAFQVAGSTQQQLDPQSNKYLKDLAQREADYLEKISIGVTTETAFLGALGKTGAKKQALSLMGSIAKYFGFKAGAEAAEESGTSYGQRSVLLAKFTSTLGNCVIDAATAPNKVQALALCSASLIAFDINNGIVPLLKLYAIDPPNPNYKTMVAVSIPFANIADPALQSTVNALLAAQAYLGAVNETYDRYVAAHNAGDVDSALLQIQAYLTFLDAYNTAVLNSKHGIAAVLDVLAVNPVEVSQADLQALLVAVQQEINANGLDTDIVTLLSGLGLDSAQILDVQNDILNFQYSPAGTLLENVNGLLIGLDAISAPNPVPEPTALLLFATAGFALIIVQRRRRKSATL